MIRQFAIFLSVGLINTLVALAVILLLSEILGVNYIVANTLGYAFGLMLGFGLHSKITFKNQSDPDSLRAEMTKFLVVFFVAYMIQLVGLVILVKNVGIADQYAQVIAIGIYAVVSFAGNRIFTFRKNEKDTP